MVTSPDMRHACVAWFQNLNASLDVKVTVQAERRDAGTAAFCVARRLRLSISRARFGVEGSEHDTIGT